jgi:hypothetical protein
MTLSTERKAYLTQIANQITDELVKDLKVNEWTTQQKQDFKQIILEAENSLNV